MIWVTGKFTEVDNWYYLPPQQGQPRTAAGTDPARLPTLGLIPACLTVGAHSHKHLDPDPGIEVVTGASLPSPPRCMSSVTRTLSMRLTCLSSSLDCAVAKRSASPGQTSTSTPPKVHIRWQLQRADRYIRAHDTRRPCASLLVALDVHPRVAMQILRHSHIAMTIEIYSEVPTAKARSTLKRLGRKLDG